MLFMYGMIAGVAPVLMPWLGERKTLTRCRELRADALSRARMGVMNDLAELLKCSLADVENG